MDRIKRLVTRKRVVRASIAAAAAYALAMTVMTAAEFMKAEAIDLAHEGN